MPGPMRGGMKPHGHVSKTTLPRLIKYLVKNYKFRLILVVICVIIAAVAGAAGGIFLKNIVSAIQNRDEQAFFITIGTMIGVFVLAIGAGALRSLIMATVTQGFLNDIRKKMFDKMQSLPIKYFDTHTHGDIMSVYTNDVDALRQMISESLLAISQTFVTIVVLVFTMLFYSVWLTLVVGVFVILMMLIVTKVGGNSRKFFGLQQRSLGKVEGFIEESMHGQKVIKVFNHEDESKAKFEEYNNAFVSDATNANMFANLLGPMSNNLGHLLYIVIAIVGTILAISNLPNWMSTFAISGEPISLAIIIAFLPMSRNFTQSVSNVSMQVNSVFMGLAGAERIFNLLDEKAEEDNGYVTLVNVYKDENGNIVESEKRTGMWAWKHPHQADGTITYTELKGDIVMENVDFAYVEDHPVLHDISLYAKPGQKVAFVGATGAGKTTITNLINRFYDIQDGKIRYDGININKIKKGDLRRSLGVVLQDTNLFTGTVMENIRYGKLDATDEECIEAAKLANAHDFITRLPEGYHTMLTADGANLSQGQRQLLSIARAAVANPPVMILDEATSSIDTRTELLVQQGMDKLMEGRTVFVIAHRLSTVQNSNVIMVLDHGRIIERGTHDELIAMKGNYYKLYTGAFELE